MLGSNIWGWGRWPSVGSELMRLQRDVNQLFSEIFSPQREDFPQVNLLIGDHDAVIVAEIPGVDAGSLDISLLNDTVTISGNRSDEFPEEGRTFQRQERFRGKFTRTLKFPIHIDPNQAEARYERGLLTIKVSRAEADKPKKIDVKSE